MWLINTSTLHLEEFIDHRSQPYAILSHRWHEGEVSFKEMTSMKYREVAEFKQGFKKIREFCSVLASENVSYAWVDTCCIDKRSSAELQEAINSMFQWYKSAQVCIAYLVDHREDDPSTFEGSEWFQRGWTLQELLAPKNVVFYSSSWKVYGTRESLRSRIEKITGIPERYLVEGYHPENEPVPIAQIMTWAKGRSTTRLEDRAYSLIGLFDVNMPMLYGEGKKAFIRLQEEILKRSEDQSIFAWEGISLAKPGMLAESVDNFSYPQGVESWKLRRFKSSKSYGEGITIEALLVQWGSFTYLAILNYYCVREGVAAYTGIFLRPVDHTNKFIRVSYLGEDLATVWASGGFPWDESHAKVRTVTVLSRLSSDEAQIRTTYQLTLFLFKNDFGSPLAFEVRAKTRSGTNMAGRFLKAGFTVENGGDCHCSSGSKEFDGIYTFSLGESPPFSRYIHDITFAFDYDFSLIFLFNAEDSLTSSWELMKHIVETDCSWKKPTDFLKLGDRLLFSTGSEIFALSDDQVEDGAKALAFKFPSFGSAVWPSISIIPQFGGSSGPIDLRVLQTGDGFSIQLIRRTKRALSPC